MVKVGRIIAIFLLATAAFSVPMYPKYKKEIEKERVSVVNGIRKMRSSDNYGKTTIVSTGISNEAFLEEIGSLDEKLRISSLVLVFPDMEYVDKYIKKVSNNVDYITIYVIDKKSDIEELKNRDYESFKERGMELKLSELPNVEVMVVYVDEKDLKKIIPNSFKYSNPYDDEIFKKYILE